MTFLNCFLDVKLSVTFKSNVVALNLSTWYFSKRLQPVLINAL